jgi:hypothetical protein
LADNDNFITNALLCECLFKATSDVIRYRIRRIKTPGWNTYLAEEHDAVRKAFLVWMEFGKPRNGLYFDSMKRTRALFKLALLDCKNHIEELKADVCAENLFDKECLKYWNSVYKISYSKASSHVDSVGGATD